MDTITAYDIKPTNKRLKDQNPKSYKLIKDDVLLARFIRNRTIVILRIDNGLFTEHRIDPRVETLNKQGNVLKSLTQSEKSYEIYLEFLHERLEKGELFIKIL